jgi:anaerobic magnesium-protoporphyrin IX monomethyl ester cyclase
MFDGRQTSARRVLVAQSYFLHFDPKLEEAGKPVPPLGSLVCAAVLRERGFDVHFFDAMLATSEEGCDEALGLSKCDALVIFEDSFNYLTKMCLERMRLAAARMIGMARARGLRVIVAGSDASDDPRYFLEAGATAVATGEAELSIAAWLESEDRQPAGIPGIVTLDDRGELVSAGPRTPVRDVDSFPSPAWDLADIPSYRRAWEDRHGCFSLPLAASRGCPFHCNWCAKPIWGQRYAAMSPERAASEFKTLKGLGATHVNVVDDVFGLAPGWLEMFGERLSEMAASLPYRCLSRADLLTDRLVEGLRRSGCTMVWIGAESGSQKILDAMEKGTTVDEIRAAAARLRAASIKVGFFLQFGYPGETEADIQATLELVDEVLPDDIGISVSYPLPGTRFHARVSHEMAKETHWYDSSDLAMLFQGRHLTRFYRVLHRYAHARFRLSRALRAHEGSKARRALQALRYGAGRGLMALALWVASRDRVQVRPLSPELSRERAATPARSLVAASESIRSSAAGR